MEKDAIIRILKDMALLLQVADASPFEIMAYQNGAENFDDWDGDLEQAVEEGTLTEIEGIGKGLSSVITDLVRTGRSEAFEELKGRFPGSLLDVFRIPGLGPKKVKVLYEKLGIDSLESLREAASGMRIRELKGFGAKTEETILRRVERRLDAREKEQG